MVWLVRPRYYGPGFHHGKHDHGSVVDRLPHQVYQIVHVGSNYGTSHLSDLLHDHFGGARGMTMA